MKIANRAEPMRNCPLGESAGGEAHEPPADRFFEGLVWRPEEKKKEESINKRT